MYSCLQPETDKELQLAIETSLILNGRGVELRLSGTVHGSDIIALQSTPPPEEVFHTLEFMIIDYSGVRESFVSNEEVDIISANDRALLQAFPHFCIAAVIPNRIFHMVSGLWQIKSDEDGYRIQRFTNRMDAEKWLGIVNAECD